MTVASASSSSSASSPSSAAAAASLSSSRRGSAQPRQHHQLPSAVSSRERADAATTSQTIVQLPSGERVTPWWQLGKPLENVVDVHSTDEFVAYLHEAANLDRRSGRARLVCVEFFAGWCFACRSLHPKLTKIAEHEYPDVLFLRVHLDFVPDLCNSLGVQKLPYVQLYKGAEGNVDEFAMNNSAPKLRKLRSALETHRGGETPWVEGEQKGPASIVHTAGWPKVYTAALMVAARSAMRYCRKRRDCREGRGDGLPALRIAVPRVTAVAIE